MAKLPLEKYNGIFRVYDNVATKMSFLKFKKKCYWILYIIKLLTFTNLLSIQQGI